MSIQKQDDAPKHGIVQQQLPADQAPWPSGQLGHVRYRCQRRTVSREHESSDTCDSRR
jgi:hypothetical protein